MLRGTVIKHWLMILLCAFIINACTSSRSTPPHSPEPGKNEPVRGVWLTTVNSLDWPPPSSLKAATAKERIEQQQQAMIVILDQLKKTGINTVFFQVKPDGTALWHSSILPWSELLTGKIGEDPGYDPLAFVIEQAHKRGLKVQAWFNPYRISLDTQPETVLKLNNTIHHAPSSPFVLHPDWIRTAADRFVLDPGLPEVQNWLTSIVAEVVKNYDIDGVHFDDYFYTETTKSPLNDQVTYQRLGRGFADKASWRRSNTQSLIVEVSKTIKLIKPSLDFGVSPAGIWRNKSADPRGSETTGGAPSYDTSYADTREWVKQGLIDYIIPQIYWPVARKSNSYKVLAEWWADVVKNTSTQLYVGIAYYKIGLPSKAEPDWTIEQGVPELKRQLDINDAIPEIKGTVLFREASMNTPETRQATQYLKQRWNP